MTARQQMLDLMSLKGMDKYMLAEATGITTDHTLSLLRSIRKDHELHVVGWTRTGNLWTAQWSLRPPRKPVPKPQAIPNAVRTKKWRQKWAKDKKALGWAAPTEPWAALWAVVVRARHPRIHRVPTVSHYLVDDDI